MVSSTTAEFVLSIALCAAFGVPQPGEVCLQARAETTAPSPGFKLLQRRRSFSLEFTFRGVTKTIAIPRQWLVPAREEAEEDSDAFVSSFSYSPEVQSFAIGDGRIGLHISSYAVQVGGSAQATAGRDVFLIFDPKTLELHEGGIRHGITKGRVRDRGCFVAKSERYLIGDIDRDGLTDVGVLAEELQCIEKSDGFLEGPFYKESPVIWYVLRANGWNLDAHYDGQAPAQTRKLALIGMVNGPLDPPACTNGYSPECDRSQWPREIYSVTARGVTAHFGGRKPPQGRPLQSGVSGLWFTFEGNPGNYGFASMTKEPGDVHLTFPAWNLHIFSPDGAMFFCSRMNMGHTTSLRRAG